MTSLYLLNPIPITENRRGFSALLEIEGVLEKKIREQSLESKIDSIDIERKSVLKHCSAKPGCQFHCSPPKHPSQNLVVREVPNFHFSLNGVPDHPLHSTLLFVQARLQNTQLLLRLYTHFESQLTVAQWPISTQSFKASLFKDH